MINTAELVHFLKESHNKDFKGLQRAKIIYRPYICPFDDLLNELPEGASIFDLGCGSGTFLLLAAAYKKPAKLAGVEIGQALIDTASVLLDKYKHIETRLQHYNGSDIPAWVANYDYVFMIDVLHHIPADKQIVHLRNLFSLMKPGAKLVLKDIDADAWFWSKFNKLHDFVVSREIGNEVSAEGIAKELQQIGFKTSNIVKKRMVVYPHYTIICEKPL